MLKESNEAHDHVELIKDKEAETSLSSSSLPTYIREHPGINIVIDSNANQFSFAEITSGGITTNHLKKDPIIHQSALELQHNQNTDRKGGNLDEEVYLVEGRGRSRVISERSTETTTHLL